MIKFFKLSVIAAAALLSSLSAVATVFNFSYTSANGHVTSGTLTGTANGQFVENISDISVFFDGLAFVGNGSLFSRAGVCTPYPNCYWTTNPGVVSFNSALNNFMFIDTNYPITGTYTNYFAFTNVDPTQLVIQTYGVNTFNENERPQNVSTWSLAEAATVPAPGGLGLLALGLAGLGAARRKRVAVV